MNPADEEPGRDAPSSMTPGWMSQLDADAFSVKDALGGVRGVIESVLPATLFIVAYVVTHELRIPLIVAAGAAVLFCVARLVQGQPLTQAASGLVGVGIGVAWAAASGRGENYFAWGLVTAAAWAIGLTASILARWPAVSVGAALVWGLPMRWWRDARVRPAARRCRYLTWMWVGLFVVRFIVQWPLWHFGQVAALGVAKLVLGIPLFAVAAWLTWLLLRPWGDPLRAAFAETSTDDD